MIGRLIKPRDAAAARRGRGRRQPDEAADAAAAAAAFAQLAGSSPKGARGGVNANHLLNFRQPPRAPPGSAQAQWKARQRPANPYSRCGVNLSAREASCGPAFLSAVECKCLLNVCSIPQHLGCFVAGKN